MLKIKDGYVLREIAQNWVVIPSGPRVLECNAIMSLNETGAFLWKRLEQGAVLDSLIKSITSEFGINPVAAQEDIGEFVSSIKNKGLLAS